jgi:hypothetical protein
MKKKRTLQKVTMAAGVVAMSVGLFNSFDLEAQTTGGGSGSGVCCQDSPPVCYHPVHHMRVPDALYEIGISFCE